MGNLNNDLTTVDELIDGNRVIREILLYSRIISKSVAGHKLSAEDQEFCMRVVVGIIENERRKA